MINWVKNSFKIKIIVITLLAVFISGITMGSAVMWNFDRTNKKSLVNRIHIESDIIRQNVATSVLFHDPATAKEILSTFKSDPSILQATLSTPTNPEFAQYNAANVDLSAHSTFVVSNKIEFEGETIGTLKIVASKQAVFDQDIANLLFILGTLLVVFICIAAILPSVLRQQILPLLNLHVIAKKIAQTRNYTLRAKINSEDEIGSLSKMFNYMVEQIEQRDGQLEKQVQQRTAELEKLAEEFRYRAFHDSLTGLPNRAFLQEFFEQGLKHAQRNKVHFACLLLDLDDFKTINDTKGHEFGDQLLIEVAKALKNNTRGEDMVCRLGGDEFIVLLNDLKSEDAIIAITTKILRVLNRDFSVGGELIKTAASIGGAIYPKHGDTLSNIKRRADVAMYRAKDKGKNQFCLFSEDMQEEVRHRLMIQNDLIPALKSGQLKVYFQPKVNAVKRRIIGCEALIRWDHPIEGFLPPVKFIPIAELVGLIYEVDFFVVEECCKVLKAWQQNNQELITISFNLSGRHFRQHRVVAHLQTIFGRNQINPALLDLEITEAVLIEDAKKAKEIIRAIKQLGIKISLDDFGTGYSSLNYLRTLPIDTVKLDRSFVSNICSSEQDQKLVRGIATLSKDLNLNLVAEGVETEQQLEKLVEMGCEDMQGYYFLKPVPIEEFEQWRQEWEANPPQLKRKTLV